MSKDYKLVGTLNMFGSAPVDVYPVFVDELNVYHLGTTEHCGEATETITQFVPVLAKYWDKVRKFDQTENSFEGIKPSYNVGDEAVYAIEYEKGKVPALLNDERVNLIIYWDKDHPDGEVIGAEPVDAYGNTTMYGKGLIDIEEGDKIDFIVDYYTYDGKYDDEYLYGDTLTVGKKGLKVSYEWIGDGECLIYYMLTDIYNNVYFTEPVIVY